MHLAKLLFAYLTIAMTIDGEGLYAFCKWLATVIVDGDAANIWLYTLPADIQSAMYEVGEWLAQSLGF